MRSRVQTLHITNVKNVTIALVNHLRGQNASKTHRSTQIGLKNRIPLIRVALKRPLLFARRSKDASVVHKNIDMTQLLAELIALLEVAQVARVTFTRAGAFALAFGHDLLALVL